MKKGLLVLLALALIFMGGLTLSSCSKTRSLDNAEVTIEYESVTYDGSEKKPVVTVKYEGVSVALGFFEITYSDNINIGTAKVIISAKEEFHEWSGSKELTFSIERLNLVDTVITLSPSTYYYDSTPKTPDVTVSYGDAILPQSDYEIEYNNNIAVGAARVIITEKSPNVLGSKQKSFEIVMASLENAVIELEEPTVVYNGQPQTPKIKSVSLGGFLIDESKYTVAYTNNINVGTATIIVTPKEELNQFTGVAVSEFTIEKASLANAKMEFLQESYSYNGLPIMAYISPVTIGNLIVPSSEYNVLYSNNVNCGTATMTISAKSTSSNFTGSINKSFTITKVDLASTTIQLEYDSISYSGAQRRPVVSVYISGNEMPLPATDYDAMYFSNIVVGTARVDITTNFSRNLTGSTSLNFEIVKRSLINSIPTLDYTSTEYSGTPLRPNIHSLFAGSVIVPSTEYVVSYLNNINVGTATVILTADSDNFSDSVSTTFVIEKAPISKVEVNFGTVTYSAQPLSPTPQVAFGTTTLHRDVNYNISFSNNVQVGTAVATLTAIGNNFFGEASFNFTISPANLQNATITLVENAFSFNNSAQTPEISSVALPTVATILQDDYEVSYENNINAGTASLIITARSANFIGQCIKSFTISPADLTGANTVLDITEYTYSAEEHRPIPTVSFAFENAYTIPQSGIILSYVNNIDSGTASVIITSNHENFSGQKTVDFTINKRPITTQTLAIDPISPQIYSGVAITPVPRILYKGITLINGSDFTILYADNINKGRATLTIASTAQSNFSGQTSVFFTINANDLRNAVITVEEKQFIFNNTHHTPSFTISLPSIEQLNPSEFTTTYSSNLNAGRAIITITPKSGNENLSNQAQAEFTIQKADLANAELTLSQTEFPHTGNAQSPTVTSLRFLSGENVPSTFTVASSNYDVACINNVHVGIATITVTAKTLSVNFTGQKIANYTIKGARVFVSTLGNLRLALSESNNSDIVLEGDIDCNNESIDIPSRITLELGEFTLSNVLSLTNDGMITARPKTETALAFALQHANSVVLDNDITLSTDLTINVANANTLLLDLNGYSIDKGICFESSSALEVTITNSSSTQSIIGNSTVASALAWHCNEFSKLIINSQDSNIKLLGIIGFATAKTDSNSQISFTGVVLEGDLASYLVGGHLYTFTDCTFTGEQAVYAKSGTIVLENCTLTASGAYLAPIFDEFGYTATGNALTLECSPDYIQSLMVTVIGGVLNSDFGYSIELAGTSDGGTHPIYAQLRVLGNPVLTSTKEQPIATADSSAVTIEVNGRAELIRAIEFADNIALIGNIEVFYDGQYRDFVISAVSRSYNLNIDLRGFHFMPKLDLVNFIVAGESYATNALNVYIFDSVGGGTVGSVTSTEVCNYGIFINGNEHVNVRLERITVQGYNVGIYTDSASQGATVTAINCTFLTNAIDYSASTGAYLSADYTYSFTNCTFNGGSAIHIKSGTMELINCTLIANSSYRAPSYVANGVSITGNALMVEPTVGNFETLNITLNGGLFVSEYGYAICIHALASEGIEPLNYASITVITMPSMYSIREYPIKDDDNKMSY